MKKAIVWKTIIWWLLALIVLMLVFPTTAWSMKLWNSINIFDQFNMDDQERVFKNPPPSMDEFNIAMRDPDKITDRKLETSDLKQLIQGLEYYGEIDLDKNKVYILKSTINDRPIYLMHSPSVYNGKIVLLEKNYDNEYTYSYSEAFFDTDTIEEGLGYHYPPYEVEWQMPWYKTNKEISTNMKQYCEDDFCLPDELNNRLKQIPELK